MTTTSAATALTLAVSHEDWTTPLSFPAMSNTADRHTRYRLTNRYVEVDGSPAVPVSGEIHFSRLPRNRWEDRLRLMKAGGITVVACYIFWIHHEPDEGNAGFDGNLDVAAFVRLCGAVGLDVVLRIGPWCHGEVRNGGFPDWVQAAPVRHRTDDPAYLALVERWFARLGHELRNLTGAGSNVIGIQLENELYDQPGHITTLKGLARAAGLTAPIWTATGWGGAELPEEDVLPLFGGYADGFWVDHDAPWDETFREHFFFSHVWDDPGIGADVRSHLGAAGTAGLKTPSPLYPAATCELGGGMATAYQRRPLLSGRDIAAVAHNKIGNGSGWQGYYMFAGGMNPGDNLEESQATGYPNDLPRFDYDFHAPIGATGRLAESFSHLRRQHAFLAAFGDRLAPMASSLPVTMPAGVRDSDTLRWAVRSDGGSGFVFITWHQPHEPLAEHPAVRFDVGLEHETVTFPQRSVAIPAGTICHWPVNLRVGGVMLEWATASPLTVLGPDTDPTLVLCAEPGIPVDLRFEDAAAVSGDVGAGDHRTFTAAVRDYAQLRAQTAAGAVNLLVLSPELARNAWVLDGPGGRQLVLSADPVWTDSNGALAGRSAAGADVSRFSTADRAFAAVRTAGLPAAAAEPGTAAVERLSEAAAVPASYGAMAGRASAPAQPDMDALAASYRLAVPSPAPGTQLELEIAWAGDVAQLSVDGTVVADQFWDGTPWIADVEDLGIAATSEVILRILPLHPEAAVGLPAEAQRRRLSVAGDLAALDSLTLRQWNSWTECGD